MKDDHWKGEHLVRIQRNPHAGSGTNMKTRKVNRKAAAKVERRARIQVLHAKGLTETDIAATVGCSHTCVRNDLAALGLKRN